MSDSSTRSSDEVGFPNYLRATALLQLRRATEAAAEFEAVFAHRGVAPTTTWQVAQVALGRAYALAGDSAKARAAYESFFNSRKDADVDVPILKQAKTEYARLDVRR